MPEPFELSSRQADALAYWQTLSRHRAGLPGRADIDPVAMKGFLPWVTLVDIVDPGESPRYRARLVGTAVVERHGRDVTGKFDDELYGPTYLEQLRAVYRRVAERRRPILVNCLVENDDREDLHYRRLVLPLASDSERVDMLLAVFDYGEGGSPEAGTLPNGRSRWELIELGAED